MSGTLTKKYICSGKSLLLAIQQCNSIKLFPKAHGDGEKKENKSVACIPPKYPPPPLFFLERLQHFWEEQKTFVGESL